MMESPVKKGFYTQKRLTDRDYIKSSIYPKLLNQYNVNFKFHMALNDLSPVTTNMHATKII